MLVLGKLDKESRPKPAAGKLDMKSSLEPVADTKEYSDNVIASTGTFKDAPMRLRKISESNIQLIRKLRPVIEKLEDLMGKMLALVSKTKINSPDYMKPWNSSFKLGLMEGKYTHKVDQKSLNNLNLPKRIKLAVIMDL